MKVEELIALLGALEQQLPLNADALAAHFGVTFAEQRDHNRQKILVGKTADFSIELRPPTGANPGHLAIELAKPVVWRDYFKAFPGGHPVPPPPPGWGAAPPDAQGAYIATRSWGQFWFRFHTGDRLVSFTMSPGSFGSPGV
jgi:hypothetical protein